MLSNGVCTVDIYTCTIVGNVVTIKVTQEIPAQTPTTIEIHGLINPRSDAQTGPFIFVTFDSDGISEIDSGFDISTKIDVLAPIQNMVFLPTDTITGVANTTNGGISSYEVAITTKVSLIDGDILSFTVPPQLVVPSDATDLHITSISRVVGSDTDVTDVLSVNVAGNTIVVTFVTAGAANNVYRFSLDNIINPPSSLPSDPFTNIFIQDVHRDNVMVFYNVGPTVVTEQAALIQNALLVQGIETPATATTYIISFDPFNPIPTTGSIEITWPSEVEIRRDNTDCQIQINRQWTGCDID